MPPEGHWTHNGMPLRDFAIRQKETGDRRLLQKVRREITKAAQPAREAVPAHERAVLPKAGGLNEQIAAKPVKVSVLTGPKTAGVLLRQSNRNARWRDLRTMNERGIVRHPVYPNPNQDRAEWTWVTQYGLPTGWWEDALLPVRVGVTTSMLGVLHDLGYEAGFR